MKTKQDIIDEILASRLTANDIHLFSERMIPMTQCHDLLRGGKMSVPTALLLRGYAARVGSDVVDEKRKSFGNLVSSEQMTAVRGDYDKPALASLVVPESELVDYKKLATGTEGSVNVDWPSNPAVGKLREAITGKAKKNAVPDLKKSSPSLKKASEIPTKSVVKIETTAWDSLPEGKNVGCRYNGEMTMDDLNDTESYVEVGKSGYKVSRAWTEFSLAGVRFERKDFKKK